MNARRIRATVTYDGTAYSGWQVQPGRPTIQDTLQQIVSSIEGKPVLVMASGRTDAGVHAHAQVAAFDLVENPIPCDNLRRAINRLLPPDIRIFDVTEAAPGFNPRHDAVAKTYRYRIWRREICPPFEYRYVLHHPYPLNEERIVEFASLLEGSHDFSAFAAADDRDELGHSKVRTIFSSRAELLGGGEQLIYTVRGSGFLKHMVRNIVGVLLEAGKGNVSREQLLSRLEPGSGIRPGPTAPAKGLALVSVEY